MLPLKLYGQEILKPQIKISITPYLCDNLSIDNVGIRHLYSSPTFSGQGGISYYNPIGRNGLGINLGLWFGASTYNINFNFEMPESYDYYPENITVKPIASGNELFSNGYFSIPISMQKILIKSQKISYILECGIKWNRFLYKDWLSSVEFLDMNPEGEVEHMFMFVNTATDEYKFYNYFIKLGLIKENKKSNSFQVNLVANYSPSIIASGTYKFFHLGYESYGNTSQKLSYIGIELCYGISLNKKHSK